MGKKKQVRPKPALSRREPAALPDEAAGLSPPGPDAGHGLCREILTGGLFVLLALLVYRPCLNGPFLWDDKDWTTDVEWLLRDAGAPLRIWLQPTILQHYFPVTATSFWLDYQLWGWNPFGFHLHNVLAHGLSCALFWALLRRLRVAGAWFAAALLAAHPVMVESVAWITERKNVLSLAFLLGSALSYGRWRGWWRDETASGGKSWWAVSAVLFVLALLAKVTVVVFPPALLAIAWWKTGRLRWRADVLPVLPHFAAAVLLGLLALWMETHHIGAKGEPFEMPLSHRFLVAGQALWFYLGKLLWPHPLCVIYYRWELDPGQGWQWLGLAAAGGAAAALARWGSRGLAAAALFYLGALFPVLGFMSVYGMRYAWVADRWVYLPALAVFALAGHVLAALPKRALRAAVGAAVLAVCGWLTWQQAALYSNTDTFWRAAIAGNRNPWEAHNSYSDALMTAGRNAEAVEHLRESVRLAPGFAPAHSNLGNALLAAGRVEEALRSYDEALRLQPEQVATLYNKASVLRDLGKAAEAEALLRRAVELKPQFLAAHNDLGNLLISQGRLEEAEKHFQRALELRPGNPNANTSLGNIRYLQGRHREARAFFEEALKNDPALLAALLNCAWMLATAPDDAARDGARAVELAERAVQSAAREDPLVLNTLAAAYAEAGRFEDAITAITRAIDLAEAAGNAELARSLRQSAVLFQNREPLRSKSP